MLFHTSVDISKNKALTPEGFLVCKHVPIARTGDQTYYEGEVPVTPDQNGAIIISRYPYEVFHPDAIASFEGKPITMHHPEDSVTPDNWQELSKGHVQNVRPGEGLETDALYADFLIMDKDTIEEVMENRIREVSCGYDADYVEDGPGRGRQTNIRGNHVALVERGRCGSLCAIHDQKTKDGKGGVMKKIWSKMFGSLTADEKKELGIEVKDSTLTTDQRVEKLEQSVSALVKMIKDAAFEGKETEKEEEEEKKKKAAEDARKAKDAEEEKKNKEKEGSEDCNVKDSAPVLQEILYRASILSPELSHGVTQDSLKGMKKKSFDEACCLMKRKSLDAAYKTEMGKAAIAPFLKGQAVDFFTADCAVCDLAFVGASEIMKAKKGTHDRVKHGVRDFSGHPSVQDINKNNADFWAKSGGK